MSSDVSKYHTYRRAVDQSAARTRFRDLPESAQKAIFHYAAEDGDAWPEESLEEAIRVHGDEIFGYAEIPMSTLTEQIMRDSEMVESPFSSFADYHAWYVEKNVVPSYPKTDLWPVILSPFEDETLQDGSHRLHDYYRKGVERVPTISFPRTA